MHAFDWQTSDGQMSMWGLGTTYDVHLRLIIGKRVVDFLLVIIELFSLGVTAEGWGATSENRSNIGDFVPTELDVR